MKPTLILIFLLSVSNIPAEDPTHVVITGIELPTDNQLRQQIKELDERFVTLTRQFDERRAKIDKLVELHRRQATTAQQMLKIAFLAATSAFVSDYSDELRDKRASLPKVVAQKKETIAAMEKAIQDADLFLNSQYEDLPSLADVENSPRTASTPSKKPTFEEKPDYIKRLEEWDAKKP